MEGEIERILHSAGIDSSPVDPSSMDALVQLVKQRQEHNHDVNGNGKLNGNVGSRSSATAAVESQFPARTSGYLDALSDQEKILRILQMLETHTSLMMETHRKLEAMAAKVNSLEERIIANQGKNSGEPLEFNGSINVDPDAEASLRSPRPLMATTRTRIYRDQGGSPVGQQRREAANVMRHRNRGAPIERVAAVRPDQAPQFLQPVNFVVDAFSRFTIVRICKLFWTHSHGFVRPMDGAVIFKLLFVLIVMTARVSRNPTEAVGNRLYTVLLLVIVGFLYHTRYLQFMYHFIWKENIPMRVWAGEDVQNDVLPPRTAADPVIPPLGNRVFPAGRNDAPLNDAMPIENQGNDETDHNFFAAAIRGWIAPRNMDQNVIIGISRDIFYLFASFFFSIFPMWQPAGPTQEPARPIQENQQERQRLPDIPPVE